MKRRKMLTVLAAAVLVAAAAPSGARPAADPPAAARLAARGRWLHDADGRPTPPGSFTRGLQPSGLLWRRGELWGAGDQRSAYPGCLLRIDPRTARLAGPPIKLELPAAAPGENPAFAEYRAIPNSDFEGLALHPGDAGIIFAVTEDKTPWLATIRLDGGGDRPQDAGGGAPGQGAARIAQLTPLAFPPDLAPWRDDLNFRLEGCAVSDDAATVYLAYERATDDLPRLYALAAAAAASEKPAELKLVPVAFDKVPPRGDKPKALLNLNDIQFLRAGGRPLLVAVARDQERLLVIDLERREVARVIDLDLRGPDGGAIEWVSPEGVALDPAAGRLWIVNDPDSVRGNYRAREEAVASGEFAAFSPLLFEVSLAAVVGESAPR